MITGQFRKKLSWGIVLLILNRSPIVPWTKNALLLIGSSIEKVWTWKISLPVLAASGTCHTLSGASSYVTSNQSNPATVNEGESYNFTFFTRGYRAYSFRVDGLPNGLSYNGSYTNPTISGNPQESGTYTIGITGYRWSGLSGQSTATYNLTLTVEEEILDTDGDGIGDTEDLDDDGDGVYDADDAFPLDASESSDTDGDGIGNNADTDDDGDGTLDENDTFPLDPAETTDTDGDGIGDNSDTDYNGNGIEDSIEFSGSYFPHASMDWNASTGGVIFSSPAIDSNGTLYVGSNDNKLHAIDANGSSKWTFTTGNWVDSTPAIGEDGTIYFGSWDNKVYALHPSDGSVLWQYETNSYVTASPAIGADGRIYVGSKDSIFYAFENNGSVAWEYFAGQPISSSAALGQDGTIYFGDENGTFHAVNPDGSNKWTFEVEETTDSNRSILSSPALDLSGNLYFGSGNGYCYSLSDNDSNATLNWKSLSGDRVDASPALGINDEVFFVSRDGYLRSLSTLSGGQNWETFVGDVFYSSPVVDASGRVYVIGYTGSGENHLFAIDANGSTAWDTNDTNCPFEIGGIVDSSLVLSDAGKLHYGCYDSRIYSLNVGTGPALSDWPMFQRSSLRDGAWPSFLIEGTITPQGVGEINGIGVYNQGATATLNAYPTTPGYSFESWTGSATGSQNPLSIQVNANLSLTATFSLNSYELSLHAGSGGSVTGAGNFSHGTLTAISANPDTGYSFSGWTGEGVSDPNSPSTTALMDQNRSITATFSLNSYELSLHAGSGGSVTGAGNFSHGTLTAISANPDTGYSFSGWTGEGVSDPNSPSTTALMDQNRSITATFSLNSYELNLHAGSGGSVTGAGTFSHGSSAPINAAPDSGYVFLRWEGEIVSTPNEPSISVIVNQALSLTAVFETQPVGTNLLLTNSSPSAGGTTSGGGSYPSEENAQISASPSPGYAFIGWSGEGVNDSYSASTTVLMSEDRNLTANFAIQSHSLTLNASIGGSANGSGQFDYGSSPTISATPSTGYSFGGWSGEGTSDPSASSTTVLMNQDRMLTALFALNLHTLAINQQTGGSITASDGTYEYGTQVNIFAIPHQGYSFVRWTGEGVHNPTTLSTTVDMTEDRNVSALFEINTHTLNLHATEGGSVTGSGQFDYGSNPSISAIPNSGYSFLGWDGEGASDASSASTTALMSEDRNLTATFVLKRLSSLDETEDLGGGWFGAWFGYFLQTESGWCFHHELNWIYPFIHENGSIWFWSSNLGWLWTDLSVWGQSQCWSESLQSWLYFQPDHSQGPSFISYQSGELIPLQ